MMKANSFNFECVSEEYRYSFQFLSRQQFSSICRIQYYII